MSTDTCSGVQNPEMKPWPSLAPFGKFLPMPGGDLFYYDSERDADSEGNAGNNSSAKKTLVLVHGLGDEADTWRHVFRSFADAGFRVIAPDLPGFGRSLWKGRINMRCHFDAVIRLLAVTGAASAENPAALAGSSLGAGIVTGVAGMRPDLVKEIVLIGGCFPITGGLGAGFAFLALPFLGKAWYRGFRKNHEGAWKSLYPYYGDLDAMDQADRDFLRGRVIARVESPGQERGFFSTLRSVIAFFTFGRRAAARKIRAFPGKIFILWGELDQIFPLDKAGLFRRLRPEAELALIAGAGHLPHQERPGETAVQILRFLQEGKV